MKIFNQRSLNNLKDVHPDLITVLDTAIRNSPIEFTITEGVRTVERQQELYAQGRTALGKIVTHVDGINKKSNHQPKEDGYGYAVDLYANPINVNDTKNITVVANHIKATAQKLSIKIEWGGDWKMKDYPHFELKLGR